MNAMGKDDAILDLHLARVYSFRVTPDDDGAYFIEFPDLPGCITQADNATEIAFMAEDARRAWIITAHELGWTIPDPTDLLDSFPDELAKAPADRRANRGRRRGSIRATV